MSYTNADGLLVLTDTDQGAVNGVGRTVDAVTKWLVFNIDDASTLPDTAGAADVLALDAYIPAYSWIKSATLQVEVPFDSAGDAGTLDLGLAQANGTLISADGIDVDIAQGAIDAKGDVVVCNGSLVGGVASVGANDAYVVASYETAAFTAGKAKLLIEYITFDV